MGVRVLEDSLFMLVHFLLAVVFTIPRAVSKNIGAIDVVAFNASMVLVGGTASGFLDS